MPAQDQQESPLPGDGAVRRTVAAVVFPGFELLDLFGPLEMFGLLSEDVQIRIVSELAEPVASAQGPQVVRDSSLSDVSACDVLLVPGGPGAGQQAHNTALLASLQRLSARAEMTASVCTGALLLAKAGLLAGRRATTNKRAFHWVAEQSEGVEWVRQARWVEDGAFFTSSGVSAGMDMSLAVIAKLFGLQRARDVAMEAEYEWREVSDWDPFAKANGLV